MDTEMSATKHIQMITKMKSIKLFGLTLLLSAMAASLGGCKEDALQAYDGGDNVCFWNHTQNFSFYGASVAEMPEGIIELDINIMGYTAPYDRTVTGEAVEDAPDTPEEEKVTTAMPDQYRILGGVIPAGSTTGKFRIAVVNFDELSETELRLAVRLTANEHFGLGLKENQYITLRWSRMLMRPKTWNDMAMFFCSTYSTQVYRLIMEVTGMQEFYYFTDGPDPLNNPLDIRLTPEACAAYGRAFGDLVRQLQAEDDPRGYHDDGTAAGQLIRPRN